MAYLLNLEKHQACQNILRKVCSNEEFTDLLKINCVIFDFYTDHYKKLKINTKNISNFLKSLSICSLLNCRKQLCNKKFTVKYIYVSMMSLKKNKSPGNDGFTKELYQTFW